MKDKKYCRRVISCALGAALFALSVLTMAGAGASANSEIFWMPGNYDRARPLALDPTPGWNTFMGSDGWEEGASIALDNSGNVYIVGTSDASWGSPVNAFVGGNEVFVAKLNSSGVLQWNTFLGSAESDYGRDIAVDGSGNVYVTGSSNATWGSPVNAHVGFDAFAAKLNSSGVLQWNTFMGAAGFSDEGRALAIDGSGNVYVVGSSNADWGSPVNAHAGYLDAFAAKLNSNGALQWNTFMGSDGGDEGYGIAIDGSSYVYVVGNSILTWGSPVNAFAGNWDAFAAKLDSSGALQWNTFMGSSDQDNGAAITVDGSGTAYVVGSGYAAWGSPVNGHVGSNDVFAAKLSSSGVLQWNTFMGSAVLDKEGGIAIDGSGNVYVAGSSNAGWGSPGNAHAGGADAFAVKLNNSGVLQWNTFLGSSDGDEGKNIALDGNGNVYVVGNSYAAWGSPVNPPTGDLDAFAVKLTAGGCAAKPAKPKLKAPANNGNVTAAKPTLKWKATNCADTYDITIQDAVTGKKVEKKTGLTALNFKMTKPLSKGKTYKWFVQAVNGNGKTKSETRTFTVQ